MSERISMNRSVLVLLVGLPLLLAASMATTHTASSPIPSIFSPGKQVRDDKQREFEVIRADGDWVQIRLIANGSLTLTNSRQQEVWLYIPTNTMYTLQ